jgi:endonuclease I
MGKMSVLLEWNRIDPPDAFEQRRNQRIYEQWQGNRNPFVDHPEYADAIWN